MLIAIEYAHRHVVNGTVAGIIHENKRVDTKLFVRLDPSFNLVHLPLDLLIIWIGERLDFILLEAESFKAIFNNLEVF